MMCSTPFGIIGIHTCCCVRFCFPSSCAQRLSASSEFTHGQSSETVCRRRVLNAFRHHRNSHLSYRSSSSTFVFLCVLNAFRHHRNSHTCFQGRIISVRTCSTPFGIIEIHTLRAS